MHQAGTGRGSGAHVELYFAVVFEVRDGQAARARAFLDPADALRQAGVGENGSPLRLGRDGLRALDEIARRRGLTRAEAARQAIAETAERERRRAGLAAEARTLMKDSAYVREAREVTALMEQLRGPW